MRTVLSTEFTVTPLQLPGKPAAASRLKLGPAQEFESQLLSSLLNSVEKTFATVPGGEVAGGDEYDYLGNTALASVLASGKGFGIASFIMKKLGGSNPEIPKLPGPSIPVSNLPFELLAPQASMLTPSFSMLSDGLSGERDLTESEIKVS